MNVRRKCEARAGQLPAVSTAQHQHWPQHQHQHQHQHQLPTLPEAVLTAILQHVPLREWLSACALVCRSWAVAVASTTADVAEKVARPEGCRRMQDWLELWAGQISTLDLSYSLQAGEVHNSFQCRLLLPCSKLTRLTNLALTHFPVAFHAQQRAGGVSTRSRQRVSTAQSLAAAASSSASMAMLRVRPSGPAASSASFLPALRQLALSDCMVRHESFLQLSQLTGLTSLSMHMVVLCTASWAPVLSGQQASKAFAAVLQGLQGLESLELLRGVLLQDPVAALAPLSTMQRLQQLKLQTYACKTAALAHLPTSLTSLELCGCKEDVQDGLALLRVTASTLPQLPLLRSAQLELVRLEPEVLACWSSLTELRISTVLLQPPGAAGDALPDYDWDELVVGELFGQALDAFFLHLGKLKQLQVSVLENMGLAGVVDPAWLQALTASTQLTLLAFSEGEATEFMPLPKGALQDMFSCWQWPLLEVLQIEVMAPNIDVDDWCVDADDIYHLASCLPALHTLRLIQVVKDHATVAALAHLAGLGHLSVGGRAFDDEAAGLVAQLTHLQILAWSRTDVASFGLQALTALTNLDALAVFDCPCVSEHLLNSQRPDGSGVVELYTSPEAEAEGRSDVWLQLLHAVQGCHLETST